MRRISLCLITLFLFVIHIEAQYMSPDKCTQGVCRICAAGKWSAGYAACSTCTSTSILTCNPNNGQATDCNPGNGFASGSCSSCAAGSFSFGHTPCALCTSTAIDSCNSLNGAITGCSAGYGYYNGICQACTSGTASPLGSMLVCSICQPGQYSGPLAPICLPCPPDYFTAFTSSSVCSACPLGYKAGVGSPGCTICPSGQWQSNVNTCTSCLDDAKVAVASCGPVSDSANTCNAGYGLVNGDCLACPAGSYSPAGSSVDCIYCDVGQYSPPLAAYCFACPLDTFAQNTGTANCTKCSPGSIATMGATSCSSCPPGTYVADIDRCANCLGVGVASCGPATYAANTCHAGYGLVGGTCKACLGGTYSSEGSMLPCRACPIGQYASPIAGICQPCAADTFSGSIGTTTCSPCVPGFTAQMGSSSCSICPSGTYKQATNSCSDCLKGGIAINTCGPVTNTANTCHAGYGLVNGICSSCPGGSSSPEGVGSPCNTCPASTYALPTSSSCTSCGVDTFSVAPGSSNCTQCDPGKIAVIGSVYCITCAPGLWHSGPNSCTNCISTGVATCGPVQSLANSCNAGYGFSNGICTACNSGTASPQGATGPCTTCPAGQFAPAISGSCTNCALDTYAPTPGLGVCLVCESGKTAGIGLSKCTLCAIGSYHSGINACSNCLISVGVETCGPALISANTCNAGYGLSSGVCKGCAGGQASAQSSSGSCQTCAAGQFAAPISGNCTACPQDYYSSNSGTTSCTACSAGKIADFSSTSCTTCALGQWKSDTFKCSNCVVTGVASCGPASSLANSCTAGYGLNSGICGSCAAGSYAATNTIYPCTLCPAGQFAIAGSANCNLCATNFMALSSGTGTCFPCPDLFGTYCNPSTGVTQDSVTNYVLHNNICQPSIFARWSGVNFATGNIVVPGVTSELGCLQACTSQNLVNGQFQGFVWRIPTRVCSCKANAFTTSQNSQVDGAYMGLLVGTCSMYARSITSGNCQTVTFESGACASLDGNACRCVDTFAKSCDPTSGLSTTCVLYYGVVSGVCQPSSFARYISWGTYLSDVPGSTVSTFATEYLCSQYCINTNGINGQLGGWNYYSGGKCGCKTISSGNYNGLFVDTVDNGLTTIVGTCALYNPAGSDHQCQNVRYPASSCLGTDGSPCTVATSYGCAGKYTAACDSANLGTITACVAYYTLYNNACLPN